MHDAVGRSRPPDSVSATCSALVCPGRAPRVPRKLREGWRASHAWGDAWRERNRDILPSPQLPLLSALGLVLCAPVGRVSSSGRVPTFPFPHSRFRRNSPKGSGCSSCPGALHSAPRISRGTSVKCGPRRPPHGVPSRLPLGCSRAPSCRLHHFHHRIAPGHSYPSPSRDWPPFKMGVPPT